MGIEIEESGKWKTPDWGSSEGKFMDLVADSPKDFYKFAEKTFSVKDKPYTVRIVIVNGKTWALCNDPVLNGGNVRGLKLDEEGVRVIEKLKEEGRIKVLIG